MGSYNIGNGENAPCPWLWLVATVKDCRLWCRRPPVKLSIMPCLMFLISYGLLDSSLNLALMFVLLFI